MEGLLRSMLRRPTGRSTVLAGLAVLFAAWVGVQAAGGELFAPQTESSEPTLSAASAASPTAAAPTEAASGSPAGTTSPEASAAAQDATFKIAGGGAKQIVRLANDRDATYLGRGRAQLNKIPSPRVVPVNIAIAQSSCTDCETMAVALQVSLYKRGSPFVAPQNAAVAVNAGCLRCFTVAVAIQYLIPVSDPIFVPPGARRLANDLDSELRRLSRDRSTSVRARLAALQDVVDRFREFAADLRMDVQSVTEPDATSGQPVASPMPEETNDPNASADPEATPWPTPAPTESGEPDATPEPTSPLPTEPAATSPPPAGWSSFGLLGGSMEDRTSTAGGDHGQSYIW